LGLLERLRRGRTADPGRQAPVPSADVASLVASALAHHRAGRVANAAADYERAAAADPSRADVNLNLGNCYIALGRTTDAESRWRRAIELDPRMALAHANLGTLLCDRERLDDGIASYKRALAIDDRNALVHFNLGNALRKRGQVHEAVASFRRAIAVDPAMADAHYNIANTFDDLGMAEEAIDHFCLAVEHRPNFEQAHYNLGNLLKRTGDVRAAIASYRKALDCKPGFAPALMNLGIALQSVGELTEAGAMLEHAAAARPGSADALGNLGNLRLAEGRFDEAVSCYRQGLANDPRAWSVHSGLLLAMNYAPGYTNAERLAQAHAFGEAAQAATAPYVSWPCETRPSRLRVGFVSGDLRSHPVGYFAAGLLDHLDATRVEAFAYSTFDMDDDFTARLAPRFSAWQSIARLSDEEAASRIRNDGVHILLDLSGHTAHNRLPMFARKPAPVQASWLGYFATTGLAQMDFFIGDAHVVPSSEESHFRERIVRLPDCYLCFSVPESAPPVSTLPCLASGHVTFGSFNNLAKVNEGVVALWSRVLAAVPRSRLMLKALSLNDAATRARTIGKFEGMGIDAGRITLEGPSLRHEYLASYSRVDIALDPFPFPGGTTTVEGLYQGVPVVARRGDRFLSHAAESIAHAAGLADWIAADDDEYVEKAVRFSTDVRTLAELRRGLRDQVVRSPLFDGARFARGFESALWQMWEARRSP
jgi:predicted O-linked N-acetylglucosamine transferase (SPINDLY family)